MVGVWWGDWVVGWGGCRLAAGRSTGLLRLVGVWGITAMGGGGLNTGASGERTGCAWLVIVGEVGG